MKKPDSMTVYWWLAIATQVLIVIGLISAVGIGAAMMVQESQQRAMESK